MTNGDVFDGAYDADNDIFATTADYYPIKYTLTKGSTELVADGNLEAVIAALNTAFNGTGSETVYKAGTDLSTVLGDFQLTWEWDFDDSGVGTYDKQDTLLGDLAAGNTLSPAVALTNGTDYNLEEKINIAITVIQID